MAAKLPGRVAEGPAITLFKLDDNTRAGITAANEIGQATFRKIIEEAFLYILDPHSQAYAAQRTAVGALIPLEAHSNAYALAKLILETATRTNVQAADLVSFLKSIGLSEPLVRDLQSTVHSRHDALALALATRPPKHDKLKSLRWRVDVTISSATANKVLRPSVILEMVLESGAIRTMEVPVDVFHTLRYSVARMLSEMGTVESHPVLKIT